MTSTAPNSQNPINAAQTANAAASTPSGTTTPTSAGPAQSYASAATKKTFTPPTVASGNPSPAAAGANTPSAQHGKTNSVSPVNGNNSISPAVPNVGGAPTIVNSGANGAPTQPGHNRRQSSVTISASGTSGYVPNGGPVAPSNRPNINFGSMNTTGGSPAMTNSVPNHSQNSSLNAPSNSNPRITSPAHSPSPIPQPAQSGGRPPSLSGPGNGLNFVAMGENGEHNSRPMSMPQAPHTPGQSHQHLRRESTQSTHSDMSNAGPNNMRGNFPPHGGRGRGFSPGYGGPVPGSPGHGYRPMPANQRPGPNMPGQFQNQGPMGQHPGSPFRPRASPAMAPAAMQQPMHMMNNQGMPQGGYPYPQHMNQPQSMHGVPPSYYDYQYYAQGVPYMQPNMQFPGAPSSPGFSQRTPSGQQHFVPGQYNNGPHGQSMSRSPSQVSERPPSTLGQPPTPATNHHSHTPSQSSNSPAPSANKSQFTIPSKGKGIVIKNPDGEVVTFDKPKSASPATQQPASRSPSRAPVVVGAAATPPPTAPQHTRNESKAKTDAETKLNFQEQVKKQLEEAEAKKKAEEDEKAAKEKAEVEANAAKEKEEAEKAAKEKAAQAEADSKATAADDEKAKAEEKKRQEDEEFERMIAEMEAKEKEEEEKERRFQEKRQKEKEEEEKSKKEKEATQNTDDALKAAEREAEELEAKKAAKTEDSEAAALFASLKKPSLGPAATASASSPVPQPESGASTPASDKAAMPPPPTRQISSGPPSAGRPKPAHLRLETNKPVEPPQPTPGMQALKSARFIHLQNEIMYPEGIQSPNPALNSAPKKHNGQRYDKSFLLQFQEAFKEKPSMDWDNRVKETVGDTDSARPQSARTPMGGRSSRASLPAAGIGQAMGQFQGAGGRTLPPGTTSQERFAASQGSSRPATNMSNPFQHFVKPGAGFPMGGAPAMSRTNSLQTMPPGSPRVGGSSRGKGTSRRGPGFDKSQSHRNDERDAKTMPLTAGQELKPLEQSGSGWKPASVGQRQPAAPVGGLMAPDMVQRKVKAALNKMTPEKFDRISDQILEIASQSKEETDGRTLRQVIALTFEKACDEAHWASMYAQFCQRMLQTMSPEIKDESVRDKSGNLVVGGGLFRKYLLNRCQEEFERGWEVNLPPRKEGETEEAAMMSDEYYVAAAAKRRGLGLVQFIGELYKLGMLTLRIMHECVHKLLNFEGIPDEGAVESLVKLLRTIGAMMASSEQGQKLLDSYFERIERTMTLEGLPSRSHFMLLDTVDLRNNNWKSKDVNKGPKTIQEIHAEAAKAQQLADAERQRQNQRGGRPQVGRGDARSMVPPQDYNRNTVGMDDLRRLNRGASGRNLSGQTTLGPPSMLGSRSNSGRNSSRLGPGGNLNRGDDSGNSSRTNTPPVKAKQESTSHVNAFDALASLDASGEGEKDDVQSPPSTHASPQLSKSKPTATTESSSLSKSTTAADLGEKAGNSAKPSGGA